jgi:hypothetical protein
MVAGPAFGQRVNPPDFSLIALPDPQMYSEYYPETFTAQTTWIVEHRAELNIQFVVGLGDNVNDGDSHVQYHNAVHALDVLEHAGVPYAMALGNHDYLHSKPPTRQAPLFNQYLGKSRYAGKSYYGDSTYPPGTSENFYVTLTIQQQRYLLLYLEYFPRKEALAWAKTILDKHLDEKIIVVTHAFEGSDAYRNGRCDFNGPGAESLDFDRADGEQMWNELVSRYANIFLVLNGHVNGAAHETDFGIHGNEVTQILADYQDNADGGGGYLRILTFRPAQHRIDVSTYSPTEKSFKTDEQNAFSVPFDDAGLDVKLAGFRGRIRNKDCAGIADASISYVSGTTSQTVYADADGYFSTPTSLPPGIYRVRVNGSGYDPSLASVEVKPGYTTPLRFYMTVADREFLLETAKDVRLSGPSDITQPLKVKTLGGFVRPVKFAAADLPPGVAVSFLPAAPRGRDVKMKISAAADVVPGTYKMRIVGSSGEMQRMVPVTLVVSPAAASAAYDAARSGDVSAATASRK